MCLIGVLSCSHSWLGLEECHENPYLIRNRDGVLPGCLIKFRDIADAESFQAWRWLLQEKDVVINSLLSMSFLRSIPRKLTAWRKAITSWISLHRLARLFVWVPTELFWNFFVGIFLTILSEVGIRYSVGYDLFGCLWGKESKGKEIQPLVCWLCS